MFYINFAVYLLLINCFAAGICYIDKKRSRRSRKRVSEDTIILISVLGGSVGMYACMKAIRHKTLHKKFMIGMPIIIGIQALLVLYFVISFL